MERIGPTMERALALLWEGERAGRTYASVLALARDVAGACGITWQAARQSAARLFRFGLVERREGALRLTREGEAWAARLGARAAGPSPRAPRPASSRSPSARSPRAPEVRGGPGARDRGRDLDLDRDRVLLDALQAAASRFASRRSPRILPASDAVPSARGARAPTGARCPSCGSAALVREPHRDPAVHLHRCRRCRAMVGM